MRTAKSTVVIGILALMGCQGAEDPGGSTRLEARPLQLLFQECGGDGVFYMWGTSTYRSPTLVADDSGGSDNVAIEHLFDVFKHEYAMTRYYRNGEWVATAWPDGAAINEDAPDAAAATHLAFSVDTAAAESSARWGSLCGGDGAPWLEQSRSQADF
jgi:hypothetical protein